MPDLNTMGEKILDAFSHIFLGVEIWRIIVAGFIMIIALAVRKIAVNVLVQILKKLTQKTKTEMDDQIVEAIDPPVRLILVAVGLLLALKTLGFPVTDDSFSGHIIRTIFVISIFWTIYRCADIITNVLEKISKKTKTGLDDVFVPFIGKGIKVIVVVIAISVTAKEWRYDLGAILAGLGLGGLAFALAAQETLANFFGGLTIMMDKPFAVGDWIQSSAVEGTVEDIGFRSIKVRTFTQALVSVPNSIIAKAAVTNWSKMGKRRITFNLRLKYQTSITQIETFLKRARKMLAENPEIHPDMIHVHFNAFGDSAYDFLFYFFTKSTEYKKNIEIKEEVNLKLMRLLDELQIEVAFPSTSVYFEGINNNTIANKQVMSLEHKSKDEMGKS